MTAKTELTPLMQQYYRIKKEHTDAILFFRLGDFYEMFGDDAHIAAPILEVALTKRQDTPMCGVPFHAANNYIAKLIKKGYRVALCEQVEEESSSANKNLFTRKVVHVITPGTLIEENLLNAKANNYCASLAISHYTNMSQDYHIGFSLTDVSTGEFNVFEFTDDKDFHHLSHICSLYNPREIVISQKLKTMPLLYEALKRTNPAFHFLHDEEQLEPGVIPEKIMNSALDSHALARTSAEILITYIHNTRPQAIDGLKIIVFSPDIDHMVMDDNAIRHLELIENLTGRSYEGSLLEVLDHTLTPMGARLLRQWILKPLINIDAIKKRLRTVGFFAEHTTFRSHIREKLKHFGDLERTVNRLITGNTNARDVNAVKNALLSFTAIHEIIKIVHGSLPREEGLLYPWSHAIQPLPDIISRIETALVESPPIPIKEGGLFKSGYDQKLDELREAVMHGKEWITNLEKEERERTGITNLRIGYTSVFGYFIEITRSHLHKAPADYERKQTLTNAERFSTPQLKAMEETIVGAETKSWQLEYQLFAELRNFVLTFADQIQIIAQTIAVFDALLSLAEVAGRNDYTKPEIHEGWGIEIQDGRHPVVEQNVRGQGGFIPNDCTLGESSFMWIITGPNMSGKSTFLRQTALIALMAQCGSYVPAKKARIGIIDRICTRIGASDNVARGDSTFMVEMKEMAAILKNMTARSFIILDEVGRGTSTFDGISIAWAIIEYMQNDGKKPLVLFATHYFELTELGESLPGIKNYNVDVKEWGKRIVFLHKIVPGSADRSYGVHVADLAGLPKEIISRAQNILRVLESDAHAHAPRADVDQSQLNLFTHTHPIVEELNNLTIDTVTPISALQLLAQWKERFKQ